MKDPTGKAAPASGFQNNGWYSGYNYYNGQFAPKAGDFVVGNPAGVGTVSPQVNQQTSVAAGLAPNANQDYIDKLNGVVPPAGGAAGGGVDVSGGAGGTGGGIGGAFGGTATTSALNLPDLYTNLSKSAGLDTLEQGLTDKAKAFADAQSKINDNPFLSESTRTGRIQKLQTDYNNAIKNDQDALAMKKQDIQTQIDLQTKQFDINSQQAKFALDEFNSLLQSGALSGAGGSDIAAITRATGISSTMIQAAISAQREKDVQTSVSTIDDGKNIYSVVLNSKTGQIISKQVLSNSKPSAGSANISVAQALQIMTPAITKVLNSYGNISPQDWQSAKASWLSQGLSAQSFIDNYGGYADKNRGDFISAYGFPNPKVALTPAQIAANAQAQLLGGQ